MVGDDELVYRSVRLEDVVEHEGRKGLSSTAFNDPAMRPSVDRASLRNAEQAKLSPSDGICGLIATEIRSITSVVHVGTNQPYKVDVLERPILLGNIEGEPENLAHAQVEVDPNFENPSRFKRLKEALCRIAENRWVVDPS